MGTGQSTHIANGFSEEIQARVTMNKRLIQRELQEGGSKIKASVGVKSVGLSAHGLTEFQYENVQQIPGFVAIPPYDSLSFPMGGIDGQVFVSITAGTRKICDNFPVRNGCDIIIDANGYIKNAKPGERWIDENRKKHLPEQIEEEKESGKQEMEAITLPPPADEGKMKETAVGGRKKTMTSIVRLVMKERQREREIQSKEEEEKKAIKIEEQATSEKKIEENQMKSDIEEEERSGTCISREKSRITDEKRDNQKERDIVEERDDVPERQNAESIYAQGALATGQNAESIYDQGAGVPGKSARVTTYSYAQAVIGVSSKTSKNNVSIEDFRWREEKKTRGEKKRERDALKKAERRRWKQENKKEKESETEEEEEGSREEGTEEEKVAEKLCPLSLGSDTKKKLKKAIMKKIREDVNIFGDDDVTCRDESDDSDDINSSEDGNQDNSDEMDINKDDSDDEEHGSDEEEVENKSKRIIIRSFRDFLAKRLFNK